MGPRFTIGLIGSEEALTTRGSRASAAIGVRRSRRGGESPARAPNLRHASTAKLSGQRRMTAMLSGDNPIFPLFGIAIAFVMRRRRRDRAMIPYQRFGRPLAWHQRTLWRFAGPLPPPVGLDGEGSGPLPQNGPT